MASKPTDKETADAQAAMLAHIAKADTFTWNELFRAGDRAINAPSGFTCRIADRLIQRERKAGRIEQQRRGIWRVAVAA